MKPYTVEVDIALPREQVVALFDDPDNLYKWQPGLQSFEHVSGEPGRPGAISKMVYLNGRNRIEMTEEVTERRLPEEFNGRYDWGGGSNTLRNEFIELSPDSTRWRSTCAYEFKSFRMKLMAFFVGGFFKKQNQLWLDHFKAFCEEGTDVRDGV